MFAIEETLILCGLKGFFVKCEYFALRGTKNHVILMMIKRIARYAMDTANTIKELRESIGMSRKEFSEHTGIPVRTLEDWEAARRTPPEYIPRLIAYQLKYEELLKDFANRVEFDTVKTKEKNDEDC